MLSEPPPGGLWLPGVITLLWSVWPSFYSLLLKSQFLYSPLLPTVQESEQLIKAGNYNLEMMQKMKIIKKNIGVQTPGNIFPKASWQEKKSKKKKKPFKGGGTNRTDAHPDPAPTVKGRRLLYQNNHKGSTDWSRLMRGKFLRPPWLWLLFATKCTCCSSCSYGLST